MNVQQLKFYKCCKICCTATYDKKFHSLSINKKGVVRVRIKCEFCHTFYGALAIQIVTIPYIKVIK